MTAKFLALLAILLLLAPGGLAQDEAAPVASPTATVVFWNRSIVTLRATIGSQTPEHRAREFERRLTNMPEEAMFEPVSATRSMISGLEVLTLSVGPHFVGVLTPGDPDVHAGQSLAELGEVARSNLTQLQEARRAQGEGHYILRAVLLSLGATVLLVVLVWLVVRARRWVLARIESWLDKPGHLVLRKIDLRSEASGLARVVVNLTSWTLWLSFAYSWATYVLIRFPYTAPWGETLGVNVATLIRELFASAVASIPGIIAVIIIVLIARAMARLSKHVFNRIERGQLRIEWLEPDSAKVGRRLVVSAIWIFAIVAAYPYVPGSDSNAFKGLGVLLGLMVSLGSTGVINQVMSGFVVVLARGARTGDFVRIGQVEGAITEIGLLSVKVQTSRGELVTVPNAVVIGQETVNYSRFAREGGAILSTAVTIGYDAPWRQVHALLLEAARRTAGLATDPQPYVRQTALSDFYVEYVLVTQAKKAAERQALRSELHGHIQDAFNEQGLQIMSPHFESQPEQAVFVPREKWHDKPAAGGKSG